MADEPDIIQTDGYWSYRIGGMAFGRYPSREAALLGAQKHAGGAGERPDSAGESAGRTEAPQGGGAPTR